jgi:hypothetical protein
MIWHEALGKYKAGFGTEPKIDPKQATANKEFADAKDAMLGGVKDRVEDNMRFIGA